TCEFVTRRRVIRLHVAEISAVEFKRDSEGDESYTVRYSGGRIKVRTSIPDFRGFLTQLRALNPAVDLSSFPGRLRPVGVDRRPPGRLDRLGARYALWGARWCVPLIVIAVWGIILCLLVMVGLATGLLPERFGWLFLVGMAAVGCFVVWVIASQAQEP